MSKNKIVHLHSRNFHVGFDDSSYSASGRRRSRFDQSSGHDMTPDTLGFPRFVMLWLEVGPANRAKTSVTDGVKLRLNMAF